MDWPTPGMCEILVDHECPPDLEAQIVQQLAELSVSFGETHTIVDLADRVSSNILAQQNELEVQAFEGDGVARLLEPDDVEPVALGNDPLRARRTRPRTRRR